MNKSMPTGMLALAATVVGCGGDMTDKAAVKIRDQAAFDLQCDKTKLTVQKISDDASFGGVKNYTFGARGCDKQATYKASCSGWTDCSVMTNARQIRFSRGKPNRRLSRRLSRQRRGRREVGRPKRTAPDDLSPPGFAGILAHMHTGWSVLLGAGLVFSWGCGKSPAKSADGNDTEKLPTVEQQCVHDAAIRREPGPNPPTKIVVSHILVRHVDLDRPLGAKRTREKACRRALEALHAPQGRNDVGRGRAQVQRCTRSERRRARRSQQG